jgi:L,D-transpeptidase ErfK/SrfK
MDWETPLGLTTVISKVRNPTWYPPQSVRDEHAADGKSLPRIVPPGPKNPLGKYAMRLGLPGYLIHGTNRPAGVGMRVTHGCVRMFPEDIDFLFGHIDVSTKVRIVNEPVKIGWYGDALVMEVHPVLKVEALLAESDVQPVDDSDIVARDPLTIVTEQFITVTGERAGELDWYLVEEILGRSDGIPVAVGQSIKNAAASAASE